MPIILRGETPSLSPPPHHISPFACEPWSSRKDLRERRIVLDRSRNLLHGHRHRSRRRDDFLRDSSADQFQLDFGQRFVFRFGHDRGGEQGAYQAKHGERQETPGLAGPPDQLVGHVRHNEHQRPVGERGQTRPDGFHLN